jgi:exodeoxyribonuclease V alpha subunit
MARKQLTFAGTVASILWVDQANKRAGVRLKEFRDTNRELGNTAVVSGFMCDLKPGMYVRGKGFIGRNSRNEKEFRVRAFTSHFPRSPSGILAFLEAKGLPYITTTQGAVAFLFAANGGEAPDKDCAALEKLLDDPDSFKIPGLSASVVRKMSDALEAESRRITYTNVLVADFGMSRDKAMHFVEQVPENPIAYLAANPYETSIVFGLSIEDADEAAKKLGIFEKSTGERALAVASSIFVSEIGHGSTAITYETLENGLAKYYQTKAEILSVVKMLRHSYIFQFNFMGGEGVIQQYRWAETDKSIASELERIATAKPIIRPTNFEITAPEHQSDEASDQCKAIVMALKSNVCILTGGPGTGKTTTVNTILNMLSEAGQQQGIDVRFSLSAPAGLAAKRLTDSTSRQATTMHRTLQMAGSKDPVRNSVNPLEAEVVVIDEGSMLDTDLFLHALRAVPTGAKLLLVGDPDQLPSVSAGNVLEDLINSGNSLIPSTKLSKVFRNAGPIAHNAHAINNGNIPEVAGVPSFNQSAGAPWNVWYSKTDQEKKNLIRWLVSTEIPQNYGHAAKDIQVLSPQHKGELGTESLNQMLQEIVNPMGPGKVELFRGGGNKLRTGDKIIYLSNTPEKKLVNGDIGYIQSIDKSKTCITVRFDNGDVALPAKYLKQVKLAYCLSIHKSQGCEYPASIIAMSDSHKWTRQLLYTGVTRGKGHVFTLTDKETLKTAIDDTQRVLRVTGLTQAVNTACIKGTDYELRGSFGERELVIKSQGIAERSSESSFLSP